ncbi:MAG: hypothetical protein AAFN93_22810, partial [Bacteroidota bacterium]
YKLPSSNENQVFLSGSDGFGLYDLSNRSFIFKYRGFAYAPEMSEDKSQILFWKRENSAINLMSLSITDHMGIDTITVRNSNEDYFQKVEFLNGDCSKAVLLFSDHAEILDFSNSSQTPIFYEEENYFIEGLYQKNELIFIYSSKKDESYADQFGDSKKHASLTKDKLSILDINAKSLATYSFELSVNPDEFYDEFYIVNKSSFDEQSTDKTLDTKKVDIKIQREVSLGDINFSSKGNYFISSSDPYFVLWETRSLRQIREFYCKDCSHFQISEERGELSYYQRVSYEDKLVILDSKTFQQKQMLDVEKGSFEGYSLDNQVYYTTGLILDDYSGTKAFSFDDSEEVFSHKQKLRRIQVTKHGIVGVGNNELALIENNSVKVGKRVKTNNKADYVWDYELSNDGKYFLITYPLENDKKGTLGYQPWELKTSDNKLALKGKVDFGTPSPAFSKDSKRLYYIDIADSVYYLNNDSSTAYVFHSLYEHNIATGVRNQLFTFNTFSGVGDLKVNPETGNVLFSVGSKIYDYNVQHKRIMKKPSFSVKEEHTRYSAFNGGKNALIHNGSTIHVIDYENPQDYRTLYKDSTTYFQLIGEARWVTEDSTQYRESEDHFQLTYQVFNEATAKMEQSFVLQDKILQRVFPFEGKEGFLVLTFSN